MAHFVRGPPLSHCRQYMHVIFEHHFITISENFFWERCLARPWDWSECGCDAECWRSKSGGGGGPACHDDDGDSSFVDGQQQAKLLAWQTSVSVLVKHSHRGVTVILHVFQRHFLYIQHTHTHTHTHSLSYRLSTPYQAALLPVN